MKDLFEHYNELPKNVQEIIEQAGEITEYKHCEDLLNKLKPLGYTFEYGLDASPFNLHKTTK